VSGGIVERGAGLEPPPVGRGGANTGRDMRDGELGRVSPGVEASGSGFSSPILGVRGALPTE
jgi:hypothetical protein